MSWLSMTSALAVAAVSTSTTTTPPPPPIDSEDADQIALERERYERVTVPVTIKGMGPFRFMVDTGAQATVVSSALADRLELTNRGSAILVGIASRAPVETTEIPDFELGSRQFFIRTAPIVEAKNLGGADGILGLDSLQDQRVLIDFKKQQIFVSDAKKLGGNVGYEIVVKARRKLGQLIITGARLNDVNVDVIIDTGSQSSVGNLALFDRLRQMRKLDDNTLTDVNGGELTTAVHIGRKLQIGNMAMSGIPIMFADTPAFEALKLSKEPALILGINQLKLFRRVAIDFSKGIVLFDLPRDVQREDATMGAFIS